MVTMTVSGSSHDESEGASAQTFCASLPFVGTRAIRGRELRILRRRARRLRIRGLLFLAASPVAFASGLTFAVLGCDAQASVLYAPLMALSMVLVFGGTGLSLLLAHDSFALSRQYREVMRVGHVRRFSGTIRCNDPTDLSVQRLVRARLATPDCEEHYDIELLPLADMLYSVNGTRLRKRIRVYPTAVVVTPRDTIELAVPPDWHAPNLPFVPKRRRQSHEETEQILRYVRRIRRLIWLPPLVFVYIWALVTGDVLYEYVGLSRGTCITIFVAGAVGLVGFFLSRAWRHGSRMRADAEFGWIIIVPPHKYTDKTGAEHVQEETVEILPASGALWTIDGRPAGWRHNR